MHESTKKAIAKYQKEKTKVLSIRFFPGDMHLMEHARSKGNTAGYIKQLIREDMEREADNG